MVEQRNEQVVHASQKSGGLAHALWMIARPSPNVAMAPTAQGVRYCEDRRRGIAPLCDIYVPERSSPSRLVPSVLLIHGGGFVIGNRRMKPIRYVATRLAQAGLGVCSIDYRLLFRGGGILAALDDVDRAAEYWRAHASDYGCSQNISLMGLSAGATLMLMHAARSTESYVSLVNAYGATDFSDVSGRRAELVMRLVHGSRDRELWKTRSPLYSSPIAAPILHLHGNADRMVPVAHSIRFHQARCDQGLPSELALYDGAPHGWLCDPALPESEASLQRAQEFVLGHARRFESC